MGDTGKLPFRVFQLIHYCSLLARAANPVGLVRKARGKLSFTLGREHFSKPYLFFVGVFWNFIEGVLVEGIVILPDGTNILATSASTRHPGTAEYAHPDMERFLGLHE